MNLRRAGWAMLGLAWAAAPSAAWAEPPAAPAPGVRLIEPGREPRRELRFTPPVGQTRWVELWTDLQTENVTDDVPVPSRRAPSVRVAVELITLEPAPGGGPRYRLRIGPADVVQGEGVDPIPVAPTHRALQTIVGMSMTATMSPRGQHRAQEIDLPEGPASPMADSIRSLESSLSQLIPELPEEPVGLGAVWEVVSTPAGVVTQNVTARYTLAAIEGDELTIEASQTQAGVPGRMGGPAFDGVTATLESSSGTGTGRLRFNLTRLGPIDAEFKSVGSSAFLVATPDATHAVRQTQEAVIRLRSIDAPAQPAPSSIR